MFSKIKTKITKSFGGYYLCPGINEVRTIRSSVKYADSYRQTLKASSGIPGFTLIELLIVIAIIGILSSVVLVSLSNARTRAKATAALASGSQLLKIVEMCDLDGGKIIRPTNTTTGGGNICNKGVSYGTWPKAPDGFVYSGSIWVSGTDNMFSILLVGASPAADNQIYCGHYTSSPSWGPPRTDGLRRVFDNFSCTQYISGAWR